MPMPRPIAVLENGRKSHNRNSFSALFAITGSLSTLVFISSYCASVSFPSLAHCAYKKWFYCRRIVFILFRSYVKHVLIECILQLTQSFLLAFASPDLVSVAHAFLTVVANLKFPETYYLYTYYEFLFSSGLDLRYNDSVALLRLVFRAIFHPGLPAFTVLPDSSFFSFFFLFLSLSLSLPFSSSSLLNLRTSLKARWPRAKKLVFTYMCIKLIYIKMIWWEVIFRNLIWYLIWFDLAIWYVSFDAKKT